MRIIKPKMACKNCKHMTRIMDSRTGKYYCQHMDKYVAETAKRGKPVELRE